MGTQRSTTPRRARSAARSRASGLALIAALQVGSAGMALAVPILDPSSDFESGFTRFDPLPRAQVFTVGSNGMLEAVELFVSRTNPSGNLAVSVEELVAGEPPLPATAVALTSGTIPLAALPSSAAGGTGPAFVAIDRVPPIPVQTGERLALVVQADAGLDVRRGRRGDRRTAASRGVKPAAVWRYSAFFFSSSTSSWTA